MRYGDFALQLPLLSANWVKFKEPPEAKNSDYNITQVAVVVEQLRRELQLALDCVLAK